MARKSRAEILAEKRARRRPLVGGDVLKMKEEDKKAGYHYRFVNDHEGRIQRFEEAGWDAVKGNVETKDPQAGDPSQMGSVVRRPVGGGNYAVLMRIEQELYDEDQKTKQDEVAKTASEIEKFLKRDTGIDAELPVSVGK